MAFTVREVDPHGPDVEHLADVIRRVNREQFGDLAQARGADEIRGRMIATAPRLRCFLAWLDDIPVGTLDMQILAEGEPDRVDTHITVLRDYQGYTFGMELLRYAERVAQAWGRPRLTGLSAVQRPPDRNSRFMSRAGFERQGSVRRQDVRLPADETMLTAAVEASHYPIETTRWVDDDLLPAFVELVNRSNKEVVEFCMPMSRDEVRRMYERGLGFVLSIARRPGSEQLVGYSELLTHPDTAIAEQGATYVVPEHRDEPVARSMKAAGIRELSRTSGPRALRQFVEETDTDTLALNHSLGFSDTVTYQRWSKVLA